MANKSSVTTASEASLSTDAEASSEQHSNVSNISERTKVTSGSGGRRRKNRKMITMSSELPPKWEPKEVGEFRCGLWCGIKTLKKGRKSFDTLVIEYEDTGERFSFGGVIPQRKLERLKVGEYVEITYKGKLPGDGNDCLDFDVAYEEGAELLPEQNN